MRILTKTTSLLMLLFCAAIFFGSCEEIEPNPCDGVTCNNGGTCNEGTCNCPDGFSGSDCSTEDACITNPPNCLNGGTCVDGACDCPDGFSGADCSVEDLCVTNPPNCLNGGTCVDGACDCPDGYEGTDCGTVSADKFLGTYSVVEDCSGSIYTVTITQSSTEVNKIILTDLGGYACPAGDLQVEALVIGDMLTLVEDLPYCMDGFPNFSGYSFNGSGTIDGDVITITSEVTFTTNGVGNTDNCIATLTKQ